MVSSPKQRMLRSSLLPLVVGVTCAALLQAAPPNRPARDETPTAYQPEVQKLLQQTYLGHAEEFPDPDEPYEVLGAFASRDTHAYFEADGSVRRDGTLDADIALWETLVSCNPTSRHALAALAELYELKFRATTDRSWLLQASWIYDAAVQAALANGRIRYTDRLASTLAALGDVQRLNASFTSVLGQDPQADPGHYDLALVNYADALAKLGQLDLAWYHFEQAIALNPKNCIYAVNVYTNHLLDHALPRRALEVIERAFTREARQILVQPAFARKRALAALGLDTSSADQEIAAIGEFFGHGTVGGAIATPAPKQAGAAPSSAGPLWAHNHGADDCRVVDYHSLFVDSKTGSWFYSYTVNFAEVLYNEARSEKRGAQAAVAWTIKDRALEALRGVWHSNGTFAGTSCDSYPGGWYSRGTCASLPCNDINGCDYSRWFCCVIHGGTTSGGASQMQFNDGHVDWATLVDTGLPYLAFYVMNGWIPDPASNWAPPNAPAGSCWFGCDSPWCYYSGNSADPSPNGTMEYRSYAYSPLITADCKQRALWWLPPDQQGFVCPNGGAGDNYFWNRLDHLAVGWLDGVGPASVFGCSADPDTPWQNNSAYIYVDGPPGVGAYLGTASANEYDWYGCTVGGQNYGTYRRFTFTIPSRYQTGQHLFYTYGTNTSNGAPSVSTSRAHHSGVRGSNG